MRIPHQKFSEKSVIEIIRDKASLADIRQEWNELAKPLNTPLMCHEWFISCSEAFHEDGDLCIIVVRSSDNKIRAIAPLVSVKQRGIQHLEFLGVSNLNEPCGLLYDSEESLSKLVKALLPSGCPVLLRRIPSDSPVSSLLRGVSKYKGVFLQRTTADSAYVPINSTWDEFYKSLSSKRRYDLRRARRRAEAHGKVAIRISCPGKDELETQLDVAFRIEASGWKEQKGSAILKNRRLQYVLRTYSALACRDGILRLCFLFINESPAAMLIGLEYANRFWILKIGYDEKWARCSPGIQLIHETIRYAFNNGLESYEFLGSDEPWLHLWTRSLRKYVSLGLYPLAFQGLFGLGSDVFDFACRKLSRRLSVN